MKTILYMTLTANGYFAQADETHPIPKEILDNFRQFVGKTGNLINGRQTYDLMRDRIAQGGFSGIEVVIVSHSPLQAEGVSPAASPHEALQHLDQKGFDTALVGGGAQLDSAFLSQGLVDEIYLNVEPIIVSKGIMLVTGEGFEASLQLIGAVKLSDNIIQLHYRVK
ncbi:MAG: dihydrofolate reductase family protein [Chloroflexi bacterium]|nr:dihydrofolate reductase family protein [Chloroflexota bacterium]